MKISGGRAIWGLILYQSLEIINIKAESIVNYAGASALLEEITFFFHNYFYRFSEIRIYMKIHSYFDSCWDFLLLYIFP